MKLYISSIDQANLQPYKEQLDAASTLFLEGNDEHLLVQESSPTDLTGSLEYEAIDSSGSPEGANFVVFNNIPVTDEGRETFEHRFLNRPRLIESEPGFKAIRVLRPIGGNTYKIATFWEDEESFKGWQESQAYKHTHAKRGTEAGIDHQKSIFAGPSFVTTYSVIR